jgi:quinol monooxygenase YgiN
MGTSRLLKLLLPSAEIVMSLCGTAAAQPPDGVVTRIAELEIDPMHLERYKIFLKEEMDDAIRLDPGVISIYAVAEKEHPNRLRFFEIYASEAAYRAHLQSPEFKKYQLNTKGMITSHKLVDTIPIQLSRQSK